MSRGRRRCRPARRGSRSGWRPARDRRGRRPGRRRAGPIASRASSTLRATEASSLPRRTSSWGSRSRPAERWKSRTVVAPPCRTSTSRDWAIRCSASRTAGRETPSTSASRRSLGSDSPAPMLPVDDLAQHLVEDLVGHGTAGHGLERHAQHHDRLLGTLVKWSDQIYRRPDSIRTLGGVRVAASVPGCWRGTSSPWSVVAAARRARLLAVRRLARAPGGDEAGDRTQRTRCRSAR